MKRPDGFDPKTVQPAVASRLRKGRASSAQVTPARDTPAPLPIPIRPSPSPVASAPQRVFRRKARPDSVSRALIRRAGRERRAFERAEVRRFTRRARNRAIGFAVLGGIFATVIGLILVAVYSPILALRTITVDGTARINAADVHAAVDGQLGTPLALLNYDEITRDLTVFPLIRSYVTEIVPPDTLLIHITERSPVGSVRVGGMYNLVDPAGIVLQQSGDRIPGVPLIDVPGGSVTGPAFASTVAVLLALPPETLAQVDSIVASTQDDVSLTLTGVGQGVTWGSADDSAKKASLLRALVGLTDPNQPGVFDVSAPGNGVFRPS